MQHRGNLQRMDWKQMFSNMGNTFQKADINSTKLTIALNVNRLIQRQQFPEQMKKMKMQQYSINNKHTNRFIVKMVGKRYTMQIATMENTELLCHQIKQYINKLILLETQHVSSRYMLRGNKIFMTESNQWSCFQIFATLFKALEKYIQIAKQFKETAKDRLQRDNRVLRAFFFYCLQLPFQASRKRMNWLRDTVTRHVHLCNSGTNVMGTAKHFEIGLRLDSQIETPPDTIYFCLVSV